MGVLVELIKSMNDALNLTSVIVSHDVAETLEIADYIYLISDGRVVAEGGPDDIRQSMQPFVDQFVHGLADGPVPFHYPAIDFRQELLPLSATADQI